MWLSLLTETGLIGVTLFTLLLIVWLQSAWRLWRSDNAPLWMRQQGLFFLVAAANYLVNAMFHDMSVIPMVNMFLFFLAGVTVNVQAEAEETHAAAVKMSYNQLPISDRISPQATSDANLRPRG